MPASEAGVVSAGDSWPGRGGRPIPDLEGGFCLAQLVHDLADSFLRLFIRTLLLTSGEGSTL